MQEERTDTFAPSALMIWIGACRVDRDLDIRLRMMRWTGERNPGRDRERRICGLAWLQALLVSYSRHAVRVALQSCFPGFSRLTFEQLANAEGQRTAEAAQDAVAPADDPYLDINQSLESFLASMEAIAPTTSTTTKTNNSNNTSTSNKSTPQEHSSYVSPSPLPVTEDSSWMPIVVTNKSQSPVPKPAAVSPAVAKTFSPSTLSQPVFGTSSAAAATTSQETASTALEAYLATLASNPHLDLPTNRQVGSIPGLFHEQALKQNHHADFGFLPKLVRKTSFDESYPASLVQAQSKQAQRKARKPTNLSPVGTASDFTAGQQTAPLPQSTPATPHVTQPVFSNPYTNGLNTTLSQASDNSAVASTLYNMNMIPGFLPYTSMPNMQLPSGVSNYWNAFNPLYNAALQAQSAAFGYTPPAYGLHVAPAQMLLPGGVPSGINPVTAADPTGAAATFNPAAASWSVFSGNALVATPPATSAVSSPADSSGDVSRPQSRIHSRVNSSNNLSALNAVSLEMTASPNKSHTGNVDTASTANGNKDGQPVTICINCKTSNTPLWRRDENGQPLCNACQLFRKLHGADRPVSLHNSVIKKRNRTRNKEATGKKGSSRSQARRDPDEATSADKLAH